MQKYTKQEGRLFYNLTTRLNMDREKISFPPTPVYMDQRMGAKNKQTINELKQSH